MALSFILNVVSLIITNGNAKIKNKIIGDVLSLIVAANNQYLIINNYHKI